MNKFPQTETHTIFYVQADPFLHMGGKILWVLSGGGKPSHTFLLCDEATLTLQQIMPQIIIQVSQGLYPAADDVCRVFAGSVQCCPCCTLFLARKDLSGRFSLKIRAWWLIPGLKSAYLVFTGKNDSHSFEPIPKNQKSKILRTRPK